MNSVRETGRPQLHVCIHLRYAPNPQSCANSGSQQILIELEKAINANNLGVDVVASRCMLRCEDGPNIKLTPANIVLNQVSIDSIPLIVAICKSNVKNG